MATLHLEIVTPEARTFSGEAQMVTVPGVDGDLGILPDHMPLMTQVNPGELRITTADGDQYLAIGSGFLEVLPDRVSVMTDMAVPEAEIDEKAAEEAVARAQRELAEKSLSGEEHAFVQASLLKSLAQLHVKRRSRH
jgi:F-type H+-transporting ATPase subunit epsilon